MVIPLKKMKNFLFQSYAALNYFEILLKDEPILGLVGNHDLCPNSDFLLFIVGCSECKFSGGLDFFVNEFKSIFGYSNIK